MHNLLSTIVCLSTLVGAGAAQQAPKLVETCRIDGGIGGALELTDGTRCEFHVEANGFRAHLVDRRMPGDAAARVLAPRSVEEVALLGALQAWGEATFTEAERGELLAPERLPDPRNQEEDWAHQRASLLRTVHLYAEVTRPQITKVFAGRGTVSLSLQLQLGNGAPQQVLWRRFGDDAFARMHAGTDTEPVAIDSRGESRLIVALANWLGERLGGAGLWGDVPATTADDVRLVLAAYRGYLTATSPRLRTAGTIMDAGNDGSKTFAVSDAQNAMTRVRFDFAAGTTTKGRLYDGKQLVELGSARETALLTLLDRAAQLRRGWLGEAAAKDWRLQLLEDNVAAYRKAFAARK